MVYKIGFGLFEFKYNKWHIKYIYFFVVSIQKERYSYTAALEVTLV